MSSLDQIIEQISVAEQDQHLTFQLSGEEMALPVMNVREILRYGKINKMPMLPDFIEGVINLRGHVVPVINLAVKFGLERNEIDKRTCIIIMEFDAGSSTVQMGIVIEEVLQVVEIPASEIEPRPSLGANIDTKFIKGMARMEENFIVILDISKVLSMEEISVVSEMHRNGDKGTE
jgi:purine-binding chemotaxis protein CheW